MSPTPTRLVLLGHPVRHSLSPLFQNAALRSERIPLEYEAIDVPPAELASLLGELKAAGGAGNVTVPHKESVAALCDRLTPLAEHVGAVNTFWVDGGQLVGDNTDVDGFAFLATHVLGSVPQGLHCALIGAGGAAAAVMAAMERWPACVVRLHNRTRTRAVRLASHFEFAVTVVDDVGAALRGAQLVVNATGGDAPSDREGVPVDHLDASATVLDLSYATDGAGTPWVRAARARGLRASDGLPMLLEQGALAFERWFGRVAPRAAMWRAVEHATAAS
ncbi:MAG: shikimate dehydrogenase [Gemmatimonadota bacterium]|nr:shikimate dehydrogenase [Gemmatimonadota bacterium]